MEGNKEDFLQRGRDQDQFSIEHAASNGFVINEQAIFDHYQGAPQRRVIMEGYILEGVFRQ
jgi:hypothetical protein